MNDQIKELLKKAQHITAENHVPGGRDYEREIYVTFAALIVRECLGDVKERIARRYQGSEQDRDIGYGMEIVYFNIIDKFGVEE